MSCPICQHTGGMKINEEVEVVTRFGRHVAVHTGWILGCTKCGTAYVERKNGQAFALNAARKQPVPDGQRKDPIPLRVAHDADMKFD